ncbi:radial spoke head 14 homolog [Piliocolobus tephrosceles]|uniref:radial spoke head 14 homolog n=1 Tax=Piliocolobus tephrosceles TaxID=591936 RepID=UPI001300D7C1|nr:radial spoke head 14 homolog [Piliocolobus tephrosceles]
MKEHETRKNPEKTNVARTVAIAHAQMPAWDSRIRDSKLDSLAGEGGRKRCLLVAISLGAVDGFAVVSGLQGNVPAPQWCHVEPPFPQSPRSLEDQSPWLPITFSWGTALFGANWHGWVGGQPALSALSCLVGAQEIISKGLISALVWKLQMEREEEFQELILDTLVLCLREDATEALGSNVVLVLKQKLLSVNENIRSKAAHALLNVSISREGKKQVCKFDVIPILVHLLKDPVEHVKSYAAGALMFATVITEGKYAALEAQAISPLLELLHSPMTVARLNATKALTMLAEAPEGRKVLQGHVPTFRAMEVESYEKPQVAEALRRAARIAVSVIEFKP